MKRQIIFLAVALLLSIVGNIEAGPMPPEVVAKVKQDLAAQWPNNYSLQKTLLDAQIEAYNQLQNYADTQIPPQVITDIKADLARQWPNNFSLQKTLLDAQVSSYKQLHAR
jgi:hypothetical protein